MRLKTAVSNSSYLFTIAASLYIIFDRHTYSNASGVSIWSGIAIIIIALFGYKRLGAFCIEWGLVNQGSMMVKTFRRPFLAGMYIYGSLALILFVTSWFMRYVERNLTSLAGTLELLIYVAIVGYAISFASLLIPIKKSDN
jgi:hypothetical protein